MSRTRIVGAVLLIVLALPFSVSAATLEELQAQVKELMAVITALQGSQQTSTNSTPTIFSSCPNLTRNLGRGMKGADVTSLQQFLISQKLLASDSATGFFGSLTEAALKQWQSSNGIASSGTPSTTGWGSVGPKTRNFISISCKSATQTVILPRDLCANIKVSQMCPAGHFKTGTGQCGEAICSAIPPTITPNPPPITQTNTCTPFAAQTQAFACPTGQTGSITQTRTSSCATGATSPTWNGWTTIGNTCDSVSETSSQPEIDNPSVIGMSTSCNFWATSPNGVWSSELAFNDCDAELAKIQSLGIKWVRISLPWYFLAEANQPMHPDRKAFLLKLMASARTRDLNVLFQIALEAPHNAFACRAHPPTVVWPSARLDFCDEPLKAYVSELVDVVAPYTHHFELFNEVNWSYDTVYGSSFPYQDYAALGTADYVAGRMKVIHSLLAPIFASKRTSIFQPVVHSTGISYFCSNAAAECPAIDRLTEASEFTYWLNHGWQPSASENVLRDDITVVNVHPYFSHSLYATRLTKFVNDIHALVPGKRIWASETSGLPNNEADQVQVFNDAMALAQQGVIDRFFWYVLRDATGNAENNSYAIYDKNWNVIKPALLQAILQKTGGNP